MFIYKVCFNKGKLILVINMSIIIFLNTWMLSGGFQRRACHQSEKNAKILNNSFSLSANRTPVVTLKVTRCVTAPRRPENYKQKLLFSFNLIYFLSISYTAYSRVSEGNLVFTHSVPYFSLIF